jgi:hypothetical protein
MRMQVITCRPPGITDVLRHIDASIDAAARFRIVTFAKPRYESPFPVLAFSLLLTLHVCRPTAATTFTAPSIISAASQHVRITVIGGRTPHAGSSRKYSGGCPNAFQSYHAMHWPRPYSAVNVARANPNRHITSPSHSGPESAILPLAPSARNFRPGERRATLRLASAARIFRPIARPSAARRR